jgi:hypothetical protein
MADSFIYNNSFQDENKEFLFENKQYVYTADQNNSSYPGGTINFDLASMSNSGRPIDWGNSYLTIPIVVNVAQNQAASTSQPFCLAMKNVGCLINSVTASVNGYDCINLAQNAHLDINYKLLSTFSTNDLENLGPSIGFYKDDGTGIRYTDMVLGTGTLAGVGEYNNSNTRAVFNAADGYLGQAGYNYNSAIFERQKETSRDLTADSDACTSNGTLKGVMNYCEKGAFGDTSAVMYYILATLPLKFVHDFFNKLPLIKGMYLRLNINTNINASCIVRGAAGIYSSYNTSAQNNVYPFMLTQKGQGISAAETVVTITSGIGSINVGGLTYSHNIKQCRIYACQYVMSPEADEEYFNRLPSKVIQYNDIQTFQLVNIQAEGSLSLNLTNGISRLRSILIVPFVSSAYHRSASAAINTKQSPCLSPFTSSPSTTATTAIIKGFNISISGTTIYQENIDYDWQHYLYETRQSGSINGGQSTGLSSGLISHKDWSNGYRYYYVDLSRRPSQASDNISRSISISGTNGSKIPMDYYVVVNYGREINISTLTGALILNA